MLPVRHDTKENVKKEKDMIWMIYNLREQSWKIRILFHIISNIIRAEAVRGHLPMCTCGRASIL